MKKLSVLILLSFFVLSSASVWAHGDEEHSEHAGMEAPMHDMHQMQNPHAEHVATLREAANALKETNPGLSAKLETMANNMSQ